MQTEGLLRMTKREADRLKVIDQVIRGKLKQRDAAMQLGVSVRQVRRLCHRVRVQGNGGIAHGLRGKRSNHGLSEKVLQKAIELVGRRYGDFGPTLASEKLAELHGIKISTFALRRQMIKAEIWKSRKARVAHRAWRERRACLGLAQKQIYRLGEMV